MLEKMTEPRVDALIREVEEMFQCDVGSPRAWMEFPQRNGEPACLIYVTYVFSSNSIEEAIVAMREIFEKLLTETRKEPFPEGVRPLLYWRHAECIQYEPKDDQHRIRTRCGVLHPVTMEQVKIESDAIPTYLR